MQLRDVAAWSGGRLIGGDKTVARLITDSRQLQTGDVFLALSGERFDGHDFLSQAVDAGASAAVVEKPTNAFEQYVQVKNSRHALGKIAKGWSNQFAFRRVAVTGNAGKTSVKEMIAAMLGDNTLATQGNFNNDIGVPLTLLKADASYRYGVIELGANHAGEIAWTVSLAAPEVVVITNVTGAHLEGFGSMQGIANAKAEIFQTTAANAVAVINQDDSFANFFTQEAERRGLRIVTAGMENSADFRASNYTETPAGNCFTLTWQEGVADVTLPLPGRHQVMNALQAIAAVAALGADVSACLPRLSQLAPVAGRMVRHACFNGLLVDDSYNANPGSVQAAGQWLASQPGKRLFILGGVAELGEQTAALHWQMGQQLAAAGVDYLITVGELAQPAAEGFGDGASVVSERGEALTLARDILATGGSVLVKGSRTAGMEAVVNQLLEENTSNQEETV